MKPRTYTLYASPEEAAIIDAAYLAHQRAEINAGRQPLSFSAWLRAIVIQFLED